MIFVYSPKISEDLIPVLYRIGKRERKPMTKVVDGFLRNSIESYISNLDTCGEVISRMDYSALKKRKKTNVPSIGEKVKTPYGTGEITDVKYWNDIEESIETERKEKLKDRIEFFLGDVSNYFEYTVSYREGDTATFDCTEYDGNFGGKRR